MTHYWVGACLGCGRIYRLAIDTATEPERHINLCYCAWCLMPVMLADREGAKALQTKEN